MRWRLALGWMTLTATLTVQAAPMSWADVLALPQPTAGERYAYGAADQQFGEFFAASGPGPHPVAVVLHGGCWRNAFDLVYQRPLAAALRDLGFSVWLPEYRRLGDEGGGWPGSFLDVGAALDSLRALASPHALDLSRVIVLGHSAGGQLALWSATRQDTAPALAAPQPLAVAGAVGLAAITDLYQYRDGPPQSCHAAVDALLGGSPETIPERFAATSPASLLPLGIPLLLIHGRHDPIVSATAVEAFVDAARLAGDAVTLAVIDGGHFEPAVPRAAAWTQLVAWLRRFQDQPNTTTD